MNTTGIGDEDLEVEQQPEIDDFEQGPIRPPSEATSLLLRVTRNCPWNKCLFCHTYRDRSFSLRSLDEIMAEISFIDRQVKQIKALSWQLGKAGSVDQDLIRLMAQHPDTPEAGLTVAVWLYHGGESIFLQDANSLIAPVKILVPLLTELRRCFPWLKRVTSYARSHTLARLKPENLKLIHDAGLTRIHVGLESGCPAVLSYMTKGVSPAQHVDGGLKVKQAGIELSEYVVLGLGGRQLWQEHARDSAGVLNQINPDFIRFRTLALPATAPLYQEWIEGRFQRLGDEEILQEELLLLTSLQKISSTVVSDHITNLLENVQGTMPDERTDMVRRIQDFLNLPAPTRQRFQIARRFGWCRQPEDFDLAFHLKYNVEKVLSSFEQSGCASLDEFLWRITARYI